MNKAFEKILERLEEEQENEDFHDFQMNEGFDIGIDAAKEIVQEVAEEYNNGWIPCSERLPDVETEVLIYTGDRGMTIASLTKPDIFWEDEQGNRLVDVIAWHPLPEPYKERE